MRRYIYGLMDPYTFWIRYIGQSDNPKRRYKEHISDDSDTLKCQWIKALHRRGAQPILVILDECTESEVDSLERWWIKFGMEKKYSLTNSTFTGVKRARRTWLQELFIVDRHEARQLLRWSMWMVVVVIGLIYFYSL